MASEKKPSIYSDRGSIGSSDELDEYGVWVKSEPQDLSSENSGIQSIEEIVPDVEDLPDFGEEVFTEQEKSSDGEAKTETDEGDLFLPDIEDLPDFDFSLEENALSTEGTDDTMDLGPDHDDEITDDFFDISGTDPGETTEKTDQDLVNFDDLLSSKEPSETASKGEDTLTEISMEDFLGEVPKDSDAALTDPVAEKTPTETEHTELQPPVTKAPEDKKSGELDLSTQLLMKIADELSSIKMEISSLKRELSGIRGTTLGNEPDRDGGFLDEKEEDEKLSLTGAELDNILSTASFTEEVGADAAKSTVEDLIPEDKSKAEREDVSESTEQIRELPDFIAEESPTEEAETEETVGQAAGIDMEEAFPDELSFEDTGDFFVSEEVDLSASEDLFEEDLLPEASITVQDESSGEGMETGLSDVSLEDDSLSLEFESEAEDISPLQEGPLENLDFEGSVESDISPSIPEEDTDIPVISEEPGDDFSESIDIDISDEPISPPLGFEYTPEEVIPEEIPPIEASSELQLLQEEGVEPMTAAPDDTGYLDEEVPAEDGFEEEALDLSNAVIDEPDLSGDVVENPIQEPSLESISLDLDLEESLELPEEDTEEVLEFSEEVPEEISIDLPEADFDSNELPQDLLSDVEEVQETDEDSFPVEEENFAQVVPEDFVVESDDSQVSFDHAIDETIQEEPAIQYTDDEEVTGEVSEEPNVPDNLKQELKVVLSYMDQLLESLPEEKIEEFAQSEYYDTYKKLFEELGLV
ncbi:hypothetical protein LQZ21_02100 [Treponema sp. TIM-1]|uniref:hypothetical protein n=1 Tax=Treponema sp. TIM-1 TaxID=2898417 RepID=UPI00397F68D6